MTKKLQTNEKTNRITITHITPKARGLKMNAQCARNVSKEGKEKHLVVNYKLCTCKQLRNVNIV